MLKSMTGFGRGEYEDEQFSVTIEMKTVNHRYNEVAIRLPRFLNPVEDRIRKTILKSVNRGRIDVFINASYTNTENVSIKVDKLWYWRIITLCVMLVPLSAVKTISLTSSRKFYICHAARM